MTERIPHNPDSSPTHMGKEIRPEAIELGKTITRFGGAFPGNTEYGTVEGKAENTEAQPTLKHNAGRAAVAMRNWNTKKEGGK